MFEQLGLTPPAPLSIPTLLVNLLLAAVLGFLLSWHYMRYARTFTNRSELAWILPFITLTTVLIISVVKSSLALSLGLVGALSIVRFRTPIKEPEELAYLFMAIAIGLGMGADQRVPTLVAVLAIGALSMIRTWTVSRGEQRNLYLNLEVKEATVDGTLLQRVNQMLSEHVDGADIRRVDVRDGVFQATYVVDCKDAEALDNLVGLLSSNLPGVTLSLVEQRGLPRP